MPAAKPLPSAPYALENRLLVTDVFRFCPEHSHRFLPFISVDPGRMVKEQIAALEELGQEFPIYGVKISPILAQSSVLELLGVGEAFLQFFAQRNWPVLFYASIDPSDPYSRAADIFRVIDRHSELHYLLGALYWLPPAVALCVYNGLEPAFVRQQDGCEKQDCELRAAERWLARNARRFAPGSLTLLGDDLYCHQPFCEFVIDHKCHFAFTCKSDSHAALYQVVGLLAKARGVHEVTERHSTGQRAQIWHYRYATRVPLRADTKPMYVNWCEVTITDEASGELIYRNAWATDHPLDDQSLRPFVIAARTRWKSENENNNVLKNYGHHLEHNFGHGQHYLAMVLMLLNLLAFLFHTVLDLCDAEYRRVRAELATCQTFFNDLQALTRYLYFDNWQVLINFTFTRLELDAAAPAH